MGRIYGYKLSQTALMAHRSLLRSTVIARNLLSDSLGLNGTATHRHHGQKSRAYKRNYSYF